MTGQGKVLFVAHVENHLLNFHQPFFKYFQDKGWQVHVATRLGRRQGELAGLGVVCHDVFFARSPYSLSNIGALRQLCQIMEQERFSLVHVHTPVGAFLGRLAARLTGTRPVVYTVHGFHFYHGSPSKSWLLYYPLEKLAARWTDALVTINREDLQLAQRFVLRKKGGVFFVHGVGLALEEYQQCTEASRRHWRSELGFAADVVLVVCVAEFMAGKNHLQVLQALKRIAADKKNIFLLLAGEGQDKDIIKKQVEMLELGERVRFLGFRRDVPELLCAADIFVLTSLREGLPRVLMEAMAAGKPVVATDIRGNRDLVSDGENGFLVPVGDADRTAEAILKLAADQELAAIMGKVGQEMIRPYAIEQVLAEMEQVYARASEGKPS